MSEENIRLALEALPNEGEPETPERLRVMLLDCKDAGVNGYRLALEAIERVEKLEAALLPFAVNAVPMLHARRVSPDVDSTGGVWVSDGSMARIVPLENFFYQAIQALGHARVMAKAVTDYQTHMAAVKAAEEHAKHRATGGTEH